MTLLAQAATTDFSTGQTVFFWVTAVIMVALALGVLFCRTAVHSAVCMVGVMLCLAMMYASQGAYFIGVVQVVVYTGAVMTLILFIIMMVGVAASDNYLRTRRLLRWSAICAGAFGAIFVAVMLLKAYLPKFGQVPDMPTASPQGGTDSNPVKIAMSLFTEHIYTMEVIGCLLIIAVVAAVSLTHGDRLHKLFKQPETAQARMEDYAKRGIHPGQQPAAGVYQTTNATDTPNISGEDQRPIVNSVSAALRARNADRSLGEAAPHLVEKIRADLGANPAQGVHSTAASKAVAKSGAWGMAGQDAPSGLNSPKTRVVTPKIEGTPPSDPPAASQLDASQTEVSE
ncbi:NADH-quinone oxidoreductase subunit J [Varibaculum cambriense]|uniref:NADH-quinone oxidoreductase subunit J n=1 Tax=Varibaculum cambriense TaxID=184870 RepID=UPI0039F5FD47